MIEANNIYLEQPSMITLTYGNTSLSNGKTAKHDFARFMKLFHRYVSKEYGVTARYLSAHELNTNKEGTERPHHHVLTSHNIPPNLIHKWWNNAVNKPRVKEGLPIQELHPNSTKTSNIGDYITKYLSK